MEIIKFSESVLFEITSRAFQHKNCAIDISDVSLDYSKALNLALAADVGVTEQQLATAVVEMKIRKAVTDLGVVCLDLRHITDKNFIASLSEKYIVLIK
jgi:hypothetical protein